MPPSPFKTFATRHALIGFFVLAFAISASIWFLFPLLAANNPTAVGVAGLVGSFGPALAAMIVRAVTGEPVLAWKRAQWIVFAVTLAAAGATIYASISGQPASPLILGACGVGVLLAGLIAAVNTPTDRPFKEWFVPRGALHFNPLWYLAVLLFFPIVNGLGLALTALLGQPLPSLAVFHQELPALAAGIGLSLLTTLFFGGPLGEEPGWRAFAQPRLLERFSPLVATLILGLLWSLWHTPLHINGFYPGGPEGVLYRLIYNIPMTFLFTWFYLRTRGSLAIALLLHNCVNVFMNLIPITDASNLLSLVILVGVIVGERMWRKPVLPQTVDEGDRPALADPAA